MIHEEWLCSSFRLCDLVTSAESNQLDDSALRVINIDLYLQPAYDPSWIQHTLETYSRILDAALQQNRESFEDFAELTAQIILDSAVQNLDKNQSVRVRQNVIEVLAEELTLRVCSEALEEIENFCSTDEQSSVRDANDGAMKASSNTSVSSTDNCEKNTTDEGDVEYETPCLLYDNRLESMVNYGSMEYPDAPPTTPLIPEMIRSQASFTRKLKGGLAKEFYPSTPPSTPKDHTQEKPTKDATADFMINLLHSLSLENCANEVENSVFVRNLNDFAAQLSKDVLHFILMKELNTKNYSYLTYIWNGADQLAREVLSASLAEVIAGEMKDKMDIASDERSSMPFFESDRVSILASDLITNAVFSAFAELKLGVVKTEAHSCAAGQELVPQPSEEERYPCSKAKILNSKLDLSTITHDKQTSPSLDSILRLSDSIVKDVLQLINGEVSKKARTDPPVDMNPEGIRIQAEKGIHELQCVLLWAVASQKGTLKVQFNLPDTSLQQQLHRLSKRAQRNGWTVGALLLSLKKFCSIHPYPSRGQHTSSQSLLENLQHLIDEVRLN